MGFYSSYEHSEGRTRHVAMRHIYLEKGLQSIPMLAPARICPGTLGSGWGCPYRSNANGRVPGSPENEEGSFGPQHLTPTHLATLTHLPQDDQKGSSPEEQGQHQFPGPQ